MGKVDVWKCDGCGKLMERESDVYRLDLKTCRSWNGTDSDYLEKRLGFCSGCANQVKKSLETIEKKLLEYTDKQPGIESRG